MFETARKRAREKLRRAGERRRFAIRSAFTAALTMALAGPSGAAEQITTKLMRYCVNDAGHSQEECRCIVFELENQVPPDAFRQSFATMASLLWMDCITNRLAKVGEESGIGAPPPVRAFENAAQACSADAASVVPNPDPQGATDDSSALAADIAALPFHAQATCLQEYQYLRYLPCAPCHENAPRELDTRDSN